jgi:2-amino-4-hydroxy-6-hydroxymethyldihydropteridine diphosphokinase
MVVPMHDRWLLLLGTNVEREANLERAVQMLDRRFGILARSRVYESAAVGDPDGPPFFNQAVWLRARCTPREMRDVLHGVEACLGRVRTLDRNAPRTMDLDVLLATDAAGTVLADPAPDGDLRRYHHAALPAAEIAGGCPVDANGTTLAAAAAALGPPPEGFRVLGSPVPR